MCGLVGLLYKNREGNNIETIGSLMLKTITHRGPDDKGYYFDSEVSLYLGHARLKIIDLSERASQPMKYKNLVMVYNGEIYNFKEIRNDLTKLDHVFYSDGDAEVLLKGWYEWGADMLDKIRGIFAFAIYNTHSKEIFMVRDRLGVKPLYYINTQKYFGFSSEIKTFFKIPSFSFKLNVGCLPEYLSYRFIQTPDNLVKDVFSLPPGFYAVYDMRTNGFIKKEYWRIEKKEEFKNISVKDAQEYFKALFANIIEEQSISDVPLGVLLSGGIDSALVTLYLREFYNCSNRHLIAYSVDFHDKELSEWQYTSQVIFKYNIDVYRYIFDDDKILREAISKSNYYLDEPVSQPHTPYLLLLSEKIKENLTVILSGEGSDEIFGGYKRYEFFAEDRSFNEVEKFALDANRFLGDEAISEIMRTSIYEIEKVVSEKRKKIIEEYSGFSPMALAQILDIKTYLVSLLNRLDKTTMAFGVEARVPFLDHRLVEFGINLPTNVKVNLVDDSRVTKYFLKDMVHKLFGADFAFRRKVGFHVPFREWMRNYLFIKQTVLKEDRDLSLNERWIRREFTKFLEGEQNYQCSDVGWIIYNLKEFLNAFRAI